MHARELVNNEILWRTLEKFARFMGVVETEHDPANRYTVDFRLRKLPLLDHVVQFHL